MTGPTRRWPLHPPPGAQEALSSWLERLARCYGLSAHDLLRHNLGPDCAQLADAGELTLDWETPAALFSALADRTGVPTHELRAMTLTGWVPWLLDTLDPDGHPVPDDPLERDPLEDDPVADRPTVFDTYVRQHSVLLAPGEAKHREPQRWRPWLPGQPLRRTCPACATANPDGGTTLFSQLPIMIGCPAHGCRLEPALEVQLAILMKKDLPTRSVNAYIATLDRRTHEGRSTGRVTLPRRSVHAGVWFRLLRTLLDELSSPLSQIRVRSKQALREIWSTTGRPVRAGMNAWCPYEHLDWDRQEATLEAAAVALHLIENGTITARGTLGALLTTEPHRPVHPGELRPVPSPWARAVRAADQPADPPLDTPDVWKRAMAEIMAAVEAARTDPRTARRLLALLTFPARTVAFFDHQRQGLIDAGVPAQFLPNHGGLGLTLASSEDAA
jgi:hypothetical protein